MYTDSKATYSWHICRRHGFIKLQLSGSVCNRGIVGRSRQITALNAKTIFWPYIQSTVANSESLIDLHWIIFGPFPKVDDFNHTHPHGREISFTSYYMRTRNRVQHARQRHANHVELTCKDGFDSLRSNCFRTRYLFICGTIHCNPIQSPAHVYYIHFRPPIRVWCTVHSSACWEVLIEVKSAVKTGLDSLHPN